MRENETDDASTFIKIDKMELLSVEITRTNQNKIDEINSIMQSIYRLIIYSRQHDDDDLLDIYLTGIHDLKELLSLKNAQMEALNEDEAKKYIQNLKLSIDFVVNEIILQNNFEKEIQLFQLLRLISPEAHALHPNRYRQTLVQVGYHICPDPAKVPQLVSELFYRMQFIKDPVIKAIYFHHELIRIHPFADGNGRVTRIAKNWMLMYNLYPPIYINSPDKKKQYINELATSFSELSKEPGKWNSFTEAFFDHELDRLLTNSSMLYERIKLMGLNRE